MTFADRIPFRPIPTTRARLDDARACGHTPEQHRHTDGQNADDRSNQRAIRELTAERDNARTIAQQVIAEQTHTKGLLRVLADERDEARTELTKAWSALNRAGIVDPVAGVGELITRLAAELDTVRQQLGRAQELLGTRRHLDEQWDRAVAAHDIQPDAVVPTEGTVHRYDPPSEAKRAAEQADAAADPGSPAGRAPELPAWVLDLVRGLDRYELEHPKLLNANTNTGWPCPAPLLALVPAEVRRQADVAAVAAVAAANTITGQER